MWGLLPWWVTRGNRSRGWIFWFGKICKLPLACANKIFRVNLLVPRASGESMRWCAECTYLWYEGSSDLSGMALAKKGKARLWILYQIYYNHVRCPCSWSFFLASFRFTFHSNDSFRWWGDRQSTMLMPLRLHELTNNRGIFFLSGMFWPLHSTGRNSIC